MKKKYLSSLFYASMLLLVLAGCSSSNETKAEDPKEDQTEVATDTEKDDAEGSSEEKEEEEAYDDSDLVEAVETSPVYPEVNFQNINWFWGSPDRQSTGGIWVYTSETIPSGYESTVDWETKDLLLVQINDPKYIDHSMEFKALQKIDDDVVKIVVSLKPDDTKTDKEVARRYASVDKDELVGKKFLVETVEGDKVDVGLNVKTSEISGSEEE
ncbi:hypothetical protein [Ureibacillus acetophenoni]|uniref:Lipoprotein n=1 Tax=Ureibacillus acetophenoni TaxID=614649 RepID=A0A285UMG8_9BACL|nr:hypothetical protein [Ureibacillus acetophenoni]SOC43114.1 hypothetical protein SAMN05877842_11480 [Ureibacillus acetophenoni]